MESSEPIVYLGRSFFEIAKSVSPSCRTTRYCQCLIHLTFYSSSTILLLVNNPRPLFLALGLGHSRIEAAATKNCIAPRQSVIKCLFVSSYNECSMLVISTSCLDYYSLIRLCFIKLPPTKRHVGMVITPHRSAKLQDIVPQPATSFTPAAQQLAIKLPNAHETLNKA